MTTHPFDAPELQRLAEQAGELVSRWVEASAEIPEDKAAEQLAGVLKDPHGLEFTVGFVDGVIRPEDDAAAGHNLGRLAPIVPKFLPWHLRAAVRAGGLVAPKASWPTIPLARRALREMVGHLIVDARDEKLSPAIEHLTAGGNKLNINLLGEAVLGDAEAERRLRETERLLRRDDVDYVSVKVSAVSGPHAPWSFDEVVDTAVRRLTPLYEYAASAPTPKFINLDMEEYKDLDLTIAVFTRILDQPQLRGLEAGIVLQAYLPDTLAAMQRLQEWATRRVETGGSRIKVRLVKGANLSMELVEAAVHQWPLTTWDSKEATDANYKRVLDWALRPERTRSIRLGIAGHNLFDIAFAHLLSQQRGVQEDVEFEMLIGMAAQQAEVVRRDVGALLLYTPVVRPEEFDVAISYLVRRLEENASSENFMSAVFDLADSRFLFDREKVRFQRALAAVTDEVPAPNRTQDRAAETEQSVFRPEDGFVNCPDTDTSLAANREWGRRILERVPGSSLGQELIEESFLTDEEQVREALATAQRAGRAWGERPAAERAAILRRVGVVLGLKRAELLEVMASEAGKLLDQGDPEVSEAIDFANYYAQLAEELERVDGAQFHPVDVTLVTPPWNFPVAIPTGSALAALAAGSAVIFKPAAEAQRCGAVIAEALWEAGVPREALQLVQVDEKAHGRQLVSAPEIDRVILTGAYETAELFRSFRPDLQLFGETSGKNSIIVTPHADLDLAVKDVVQSAFGHAGQKCSAASTVILVGTAATSRRFRNQLVDAVRSLHVARPEDITAQMGPVIAAPEGKLLRGLTQLGEGEHWVIEPRQLDETGKLWSPGVRAGVRPGSEYHLTEYFGPILGVMTAETLEEAIELQNAPEYGLTAGLHSLNSEELALWLDRVQAGNVYVNRGITGAIVRRQSFGGWKKSSVGTGTKAGGPSYLMALGEWTSRPSTAIATPSAEPVKELLRRVREPHALSAVQREFLTRATSSDAAAWAAEFGLGHDPSQLGLERNILRYVPQPVHVRADADADLAHTLRVLAAGLAAGAPITFSTARPVPVSVAGALEQAGVRIVEESDDAWRDALRGIRRRGPRELAGTRFEGMRIRLIGADHASVYEALEGRPDLGIYHGPVTEAGRVEMLPFLREQAVSITAHRFGNPDRFSEGVI
ncbi:bifunctional proline dehydrogenase/L-glutamate gamma-semialdehyde dehydrogenase [Rothia kristinae]|uniref:bifunctional proline dehydrogenase/L-glutamate gamma-semialdehyde dehydrogenase n=1 Tax=Rothia kristinae TaxID=37923 RepID=UPI002E2D04A3|nr:bifunctional proline dehydrogenase/L-glutamate gamma-semialdehyde dehydrogenase [Rothia kristinae]MED6047050.1 bifunctional proline dehydrogenase/L-glutamate gamma-semialdehyde dehydrogenase [Rothia kristinae]